MKPIAAELERLVDLYTSGRALPEQVARLEQWLWKDAGALDYFLLQLDLHASLAVDGTLRADRLSTGLGGARL